MALTCEASAIKNRSDSLSGFVQGQRPRIFKYEASLKILSFKLLQTNVELMNE